MASMPSIKFNEKSLFANVSWTDKKNIIDQSVYLSLVVCFTNET